MKKKTEELKNLKTEELEKKAAELRQELFRARISRAKSQLKNPLQLRHLRREIARVLTVITEKGAG